MRFSTFCVLFVVFLTTFSWAEPEHDFQFSARLRHAFVEIGPENEVGRGVSGLFRLGVSSEWNQFLSTELGYDYVETGWQDEHSDLVRFNGQPNILDIPNSDIKLANLRLNFTHVSLNVGRQRLEYDNHRFIATNGFWQNDQTFDTAGFSLPLLSSAVFRYQYVSRANRIFGRDADERLRSDDGTLFDILAGQRPVRLWGEHDHQTHLLNLDIKEWDYSHVKAYYYHIDNKDFSESSNRTLGGSYEFERKLNGLRYLIYQELATQDVTEAPGASRVNYSHTQFGLGKNSLQISLNYEVLGSNGEVAFRTPLGALHDFQGWADSVRALDNLGVRDAYLKIFWRKFPLKMDFRYHEFSADEGGNDLGDEYDLDITYKISKMHRLNWRLAKFKADSNGVFQDTFRSYFSYSYNL